MAGRTWSHDELMLAMNLDCRLPFGKLHARNHLVLAATFAPFAAKPITLPQKFHPDPAFLASHRETIFRG